MAKGLKLKVKKCWGLIPTFVEVTGQKLVGGLSVFNNFGLLLRNVRFHYGNNKFMEIRKTGFKN